MLAIINACYLVFSSHLCVVISLISHVLCLQPHLYVVPMNSSSFSFFKTSDSFLKGRLNGKSLGLEVRGKDGSLRLWLRERFWRHFWCRVDQMWSPKEGAAKHERNSDVELEACLWTWSSNTNTSIWPWAS